MFQKIYHFLRLIRLLNILVIALTMIVVEFFLTKYLLIDTNIVHQASGIKSPPTILSIIENVFNFQFILLLTSTLLIAGAGNIINDYFDVKADRINKPDRLIIGLHIKRRWAMLFHWTFNVIGLLLALYLGYLIQNIYIPIVALLSINLLWFYSAYYKRQPFIGNILVATLLGFIPVYILIYNISLSQVFNNRENFMVLAENDYFLKVVLFTGLLAFLLNIVRELIKDIIDIRGDLTLGAKTFPIKYGIKKTKQLIGIFYFLIFMMGGLFFYFIVQTTINLMLDDLGENGAYLFNYINLSAFLLLLAITFILLVTSLFFVYRKSKKGYKTASYLLKAAMLCGLVIPIFL
ncbi:UbiA family prenyltransferase [Putridiphycobacter roseus]|nr:UbiA family prenyltransferase [Putridiphycobacter roseus]